MRIVGIVQARMSSTRLPGKVLRNLAGRPMLARVITRCRRARLLSDLLVATTVQPEDDAIVSMCAEYGCAVWRGSLDDVLDRYYRAASAFGAEAIVRITSDCPMIDPGVIDRVCAHFLDRQPVDYVSNTVFERTYPRGLDSEVFSFQTLARAWKEDGNPASREHVTPYIYRNPDQFRIEIVKHDTDLSALRWTVDTLEDYEFARTVYGHFGDDSFTWVDALQAVIAHPEWSEINKSIVQKAVV